MIKVNGLNKFYIEQQILKNINLDLSSDIYALRGKSGSGKSTLLNILGTLDDFDNGEVFILGNSINKLNDRELTQFRLQNLGFIFQQFNLINVLSVYQNIEFPLVKTQRDKNIRETVILDIARQLEIEDLLTKKPKQLSGGQQQRVAIARAFINKPKIILADEPTASLDSKNSEIVMNLIKNLVQSKQVLAIIATHDEFCASFCNKQILIKDGEIIND